MIDVAAWVLISLVALLLVVHRRQLAAIWFRTEDPRTVCIFRVLLGGLLFMYVHDLAVLEDYLFSNEGLYVGELARYKFGRGERWSLLYDLDSPRAVSVYMWTLRASCVALAIGLATPVSKWLTFGLLIGMINRNPIFWAGDHIFAGFLFLLCLSRCGQVYSVDAWIRRWRGREPGTDAIPSWPRHLMILYMIPMLCANGLAKSGKMWGEGDAFYYVINHPWWHPTPMWRISELFGTNLFRIMTWTTHVFEILFPLVVVGLVVRIWREEKLESLRGRMLWISRAITFSIGVVIIWFATVRWNDERHLPYFAVIGLGLCLCWVAPLLALARRMPERALRWIVGRRVWATLLLLFSTQLFFVLEIGWFTGVVMCTTLLLFDGEELGRARTPSPRSAPVSGPKRRALIAVLSAWHVVAIASAVLPADDPTSEWRKLLQRPFTIWVYNTVGWQSWHMFAGGVQDRPHELHIHVMDDSGVEHPVGDGLLLHEDTDRALTKRYKIRTNIIQKRGYRRYHALWLCRTFPDAVVHEVRFEVVQLTILSPEELQEHGVRDAVARMEALRTTRTLAVISCPE